MEIDQLINTLTKYGFNQYEARTYTGLLALGTANAYSISKKSGVPKARVYDVLDSLAEKGLVMVEESSEGTKQYSPLPCKIFMERLKNNWENDYTAIKEELINIEAHDDRAKTYVFTIKGCENIETFAINLLTNAKKHILLSCWPYMHDLLKDALIKCSEKGVQILGIGHDLENAIPEIELHNCELIHENMSKSPWFILSVDSQRMIYGYSADLNREAFYTEDQAHIYLLEDYIKHDILVNQFMARNKNNNEELITMTLDLEKLIN